MDEKAKMSQTGVQISLILAFLKSNLIIIVQIELGR